MNIWQENVSLSDSISVHQLHNNDKWHLAAISKFSYEPWITPNIIQGIIKVTEPFF